MVAGGGGELDREEGGEAAGGDDPQGEGGVDTGGHPGRDDRAGHQQVLQCNVRSYCG